MQDSSSLVYQPRLGIGHVAGFRDFWRRDFKVTAISLAMCLLCITRSGLNKRDRTKHMHRIRVLIAKSLYTYTTNTEAQYPQLMAVCT